MKTLLGLGLLSSTLLLGALPSPQAPFCTTDNKDTALACMCLSYHPDLCSEEGPIPSCCKSTEDHSKAKSCHCCVQKKNPKVLGTYEHIR